MDDLLKLAVIKKLERELGCSVEIGKKEWEGAIIDTINDVYTNKLCSLKDVTFEYFIETITRILAIK